MLVFLITELIRALVEKDDHWFYIFNSIVLKQQCLCPHWAPEAWAGFCLGEWKPFVNGFVVLIVGLYVEVTDLRHIFYRAKIKVYYLVLMKYLRHVQHGV